MLAMYYNNAGGASLIRILSGWKKVSGLVRRLDFEGRDVQL